MARLLAVMREFVVELPAPYARIAAVAAAEFAHDLRDLFAVLGDAPAGVLPRAVLLAAAGGVDHEHRGVFFGEPDRWREAWGAEDDLELFVHAARCGRATRIKRTLGGSMNGEFAQVHNSRPSF